MALIIFLRLTNYGNRQTQQNTNVMMRLIFTCIQSHLYRHLFSTFSNFHRQRLSAKRPLHRRSIKNKAHILKLCLSLSDSSHKTLLCLSQCNVVETYLLQLVLLDTKLLFILPIFMHNVFLSS